MRRVKPPYVRKWLRVLKKSELSDFAQLSLRQGNLEAIMIQIRLVL